MTPLQSYRDIPLGRGFVSLVDADDYEWLMQWRWHVKTSAGGRKPYAQTYDGGGRRYCRRLLMHRLILGLQPGDNRQGDHRNGNGLDNRRDNLRIASVPENNRNANIRKDNSSGFRGVSAHRNKFIAKIWMNGKKHHLGSFNTPQLAAEAYARASLSFHGEFSNIAARAKEGK